MDFPVRRISKVIFLCYKIVWVEKCFNITFIAKYKNEFSVETKKDIYGEKAYI